MSDAWHALEIEEAAREAGVNDGLLRLSLDGSLVSEQSGLEDDTLRVAEALLEAVGVQVMRLVRAKKNPLETMILIEKGEAKAVI